jgi:hypothetical protein
MFAVYIRCYFAAISNAETQERQTRRVILVQNKLGRLKHRSARFVFLGSTLL